MKLSPAERETIILFSDADDTASVYTYDRRLIKKLDALCRKCPEEVYEEKKRSSAGAKSYIVPKSCVSVREPGARQPADAQRRPALSRRTEAKAAIRMNNAGRWARGFGSAPCFPERMVYGRKTEQPGQAEGDHGEY